MNYITCSVAGCKNLVAARGLCSKHYYRWQRYGDPLKTKLRPPLTDEQKREIRERRQRGQSIERIAEEMAVGVYQVRHYCRSAGLGGPIANPCADYEGSLANFLRRFEEKFGGRLRYIAGYEHCDSNVRVQCLVCFNEYSLNAQVVRKKKKHRGCPHCRERKRQLEADLRIAKALEKRLASLMRRQAALQERKSKMRQYKCRVCRERFEDVRYRAYCSSKCARKAENRRKEIARRMRMRANGAVDLTITLERLIERDNGICKLCGGPVDVGADPNSDWYPSVDHIIPLSRGGTHTWDNVHLDHRRCNTEKRDALPLMR